MGFGDGEHGAAVAVLTDLSSGGVVTFGVMAVGVSLASMVAVEFKALFLFDLFFVFVILNPLKLFVFFIEFHKIVFKAFFYV